MFEPWAPAPFAEVSVCLPPKARQASRRPRSPKASAVTRLQQPRPDRSDPVAVGAARGGAQVREGLPGSQRGAGRGGPGPGPDPRCPALLRALALVDSSAPSGAPRSPRACVRPDFAAAQTWIRQPRLGAARIFGARCPGFRPASGALRRASVAPLSQARKTFPRRAGAAGPGHCQCRPRL